MFVSLCLAAFAMDADPVDGRAALQPLGGLVAAWKGTGYPDGTRAERAQGFWVEAIEWAWHFRGDGASLRMTAADGKHFRSGELRHLPDTDEYELKLTTPDRAEQVFVGKRTTGKQKEQILTLARVTETEAQQLTFTLLHGNRYLYQLATKPAGATAFARVYQVGATKEGEPFAERNAGPTCIVTGGRGTTAVSYKGKTYYVCCSGCKDEFNAEPEKYIKLAAEKK